MVSVPITTAPVGERMCCAMIGPLGRIRHAFQAGASAPRDCLGREDDRLFCLTTQTSARSSLPTPRRPRYPPIRQGGVAGPAARPRGYQQTRSTASGIRDRIASGCKSFGGALVCRRTQPRSVPGGCMVRARCVAPCWWNRYVLGRPSVGSYAGPSPPVNHSNTYTPRPWFPRPAAASPAPRRGRTRPSRPCAARPQVHRSGKDRP